MGRFISVGYITSLVGHNLPDGTTELNSHDDDGFSLFEADGLFTKLVISEFSFFINIPLGFKQMAGAGQGFTVEVDGRAKVL